MGPTYWKSLVLFSVLAVSIAPNKSRGQTQTFAVVDDSVSVVVTGESTLHDWSAIASSISTYADELVFTLAEGEALGAFSFKVEVASMDGGRGASMNDKIYAALKSSSFPSITYVQSKPAVLKMSGATSFMLVSEGILTIAGKSIDTSVNVDGILEDGLLKLSASKSLKMTDFEIDPPSAMFGQIQTKDDISVDIQFIYLLK